MFANVAGISTFRCTRSSGARCEGDGFDYATTLRQVVIARDDRRNTKRTSRIACRVTDEHVVKQRACAAVK
jgi:hypothetical protein